ncbi:MAG: Flp pilus assembly protein RcpC/CpaB, partial [Myxococcaceae bacterium]|nr:Flp pilus assembly protein RcpC/CpaB [Myxococcaceae bacterium]
LLQNIKLLAVGAVSTLHIGGAHLRYTTLSLLLDPEEARDLAVALRVGDLTATLRGDGDTQLVPREGRTTIQTLLVGTRVKALQRKRFETIQTIRAHP